MRTILPAALLALALPACAPAPPPPPPAPSGPAIDEPAARRAVEVALKSLSKRNFEVTECDVLFKRIVADEATARAGDPVGEKCTMLVTQRPDHAWIVAVRPATTAAPSRAGGSIAVVTVTPGGEGVSHIEYVR